MTSRNFLKYSGVWGGVVLNPYHWQLKFKSGSESILDDDIIFGFSIYLGPFWVRLIIDDGGW